MYAAMKLSLSRRPLCPEEPVRSGTVRAVYKEGGPPVNSVRKFMFEMTSKVAPKKVRCSTQEARGG